MGRGVGRRASGRGWGRAGWLAAALLLAACRPAPEPEAMPAPHLPPALPAVAPDPAPPVLAPPEPEPVPAPAEVAAVAAPPPPRTFAVLVGIDDYPRGTRDLRSAVNDAGDVDAALAAYGVPPEHRLRVLGPDATAAGILAALDRLVLAAGPQDTAVVLLAGHVRELGPGVEGFVAADGTVLPDHELAARLAPLRAARTWLLVATCYAGGFTELLAPGRILTAAAPAGRLAFENLRLGRSYLVEYVVRRAMLGGAAGGSVEEAVAWAEAALRREHPRRVPVQFDHLDGELRLGPPPARFVPPPAPAGAPPATAPPPATTTTSTTAPPPRRTVTCLLCAG